MFAFFLKQRSLPSLICLTALIITTFLFLLLPSNFTWQGYQSGAGDLAQHLSGWYAFVQQPWAFPVLKTNLLNYPIGTTILLTDSIPLFALIFKPFTHLLPLEFNYFGIFVIFTYLLQGFSALTLACAVRQKNILFTVALVLLSITAPIMSYRIGGEDSLGCQGLILLALSGYFFVWFKRFSVKGCHIFFGLLIGTAFLIHAYFVGMIYPFYLISLLKLKKDYSLSYRTLIKPVVYMHLGILIEYVVCGMWFGRDNHGGLNDCTMNLLSPFYGGWLTHDAQMTAYPQQGEGFAYLGLGMLFILLIACFLRRGQFKQLSKTYKPLFIVAIAFFVYAILQDIYLGHLLILKFHFPAFFLPAAFRTNGRFIWPTEYILMLAGLITVINRLPRASVVIIFGLVLLQIFDVSGYLKSTKLGLMSDFTPSTSNNPQTSEINALIAASQLVVFYPKFPCQQTNAEYMLLIATQLETAKLQVPINTAYTARTERATTYCTDDADKFSNLTPKLLIASVDNPSPTIIKLLQKNPNPCKIIDKAYYCEYQ